MSLYRFNKVKENFFPLGIYIEELEDVDNLVNVIDVVFPGIRDYTAGYYYPEDCLLAIYGGSYTQYLIPRKVQFKNNGILYDDNIHEIIREAEAQRWVRWKRNLNRKYAGNYGNV